MRISSVVGIAMLMLAWVRPVSAQCPDGSDATLGETTEWIVSKIEGYGGRILPPTRYEVWFKGDKMTIYELGIDENGRLNDTASIVTIHLKDLDLNALAIRYINKAKTRFGLTIDAKNEKMSFYSPTLGNLDTAFEIILDCEKEPDLPERLKKAFRHGYCVSGGMVKEKF